MDEFTNYVDLEDDEKAVTPDVPKYLIPDKVYDVLKWIGLVVLHALSFCVLTVGNAWKLDSFVIIATATTIEAIGTFIGACIGASAVAANGR